MSSKCYATSQELYDHWKVQHLDDSSCERPYRCGVAGCGKGWKVCLIKSSHNVSCAHFRYLEHQWSPISSTAVRYRLLFYYDKALTTRLLYRSKAHFQQAISASLNRQGEATTTEGAGAPSTAPKKKLFTCPLPNCPNQYKQMSGLRYHLAHVRTPSVERRSFSLKTAFKFPAGSFTTIADSAGLCTPGFGP